MKCCSNNIKIKTIHHIANHVAGIWVLKAVDPSGYNELTPFLFMSIFDKKIDKKFTKIFFFVYVNFNTQIVKIVIEKQIQMYFSAIKPKMDIFLWFPGFRFEPYTQKQKLGNHGNSKKWPNCENVASKAVEMLFK